MPLPPAQRARAKARWISALAVSAVALTAVLAAVMTRHADTTAESSGNAPSVPPAVPGVVKAPPLVITTPVLQVPAAAKGEPRANEAPQSPQSRAMGAAPACANCGVVQSVVAVEGHARGERRTVGYVMQIRMDDGSVRLVEHRGAVAAGSRVVVDRGAVRTMPTQG